MQEVGPKNFGDTGPASLGWGVDDRGHSRPILRWEKIAIFGLKSQIFPTTLVYFTPPLRELCLEFSNGGSSQKLVMPLPESGKFDDSLCAFISIHYQSEIDGEIC